LAVHDLRASTALLGTIVVSAQAKTYEQKLADCIRLLASNLDGEVVASARALGRLLAARDIDFNDFASAIEKLVSGGLTEAEMKRVFAEGRAQGLEEAERNRPETSLTGFTDVDGAPNWETIAVYLQREKRRLDSRHHTFIDDMAANMTWGRPPTEKQRTYLLSLFRKIGGTIS
jgi:hypothetical protein